MKRFLFFILLILSFGLYVNSVNSVETEEDLRVRSGAFTKVMPREEFSTLTSDIGDNVTFINVQDMYVYETNAIPENTIFFGQIVDIREPVEGKDGALKIHIYKMITPDRKVYKLNAYIQGDADNYIGGRNTEPTYYHKTPHYVKGLRPMLQAVPLNVFDMGKHTIVKPGAELFIVFESDVILK